MCSKVLAELVTDSYSICADIFCTRTSHDWSLRQIIAVFRTASDEIRYTKVSTVDSKREILERSIIYKALLRIHEPQFDQRDKQSFRSIIDHVFCDDIGEKIPFLPFELHKCIVDLCSSERFMLTPKQSFVHVVGDLYESLYARHGVIVLGSSMVGKTTSIKLLTAAMSKLKAHSSFLPEHFKNFVSDEVATHVVN